MTDSNYTTLVFPRNPEDPNPTAPAAMLALPAPSSATLRAARRARHIARERVLRRKRIAALVSGITLSHRGTILALPAWVGLPAAWDTSPRQYTATISMQQRIVEMSGIDTGNPNDSHAKLMREYLAKQAAKQEQAALPTLIEEPAQIAACEDDAQEGVIKIKPVKLSNAQQKLLETLAIESIFLKRGTDLQYGLWEDRKYGLRQIASRVDRRIVESLIKRGMIAERAEQYPEPYRPKFDITEAGRAALIGGAR